MISWVVADQCHPSAMISIRVHSSKISGCTPPDFVQATPESLPPKRAHAELTCAEAGGPPNQTAKLGQ
jgi:hypothetical protein